MNHGGDIYTNNVQLDFSVNINPLGMPEEVEKALAASIKKCVQYPDIKARRLRDAVSQMLGVPQEFCLFGNGASELFPAVMHAMKPEHVLIPVPSFYGYEYAAEAVQSAVTYLPLREERQYLPGEELNAALTHEVDVLILANPNNPTGQKIGKKELKSILDICVEKNIFVILDECFIEFCGEEYSMVPEIRDYPNLCIVRAFTKSFAIPGVRLGYLLCSDEILREKIKKQLPEWNISVFAQEAGVACTKEQEYLKRSRQYIRAEREFLARNLKKMSIRVFDGEADFLLLYSEEPLYEELLKKGILIRDCRNFRGLSQGYYRIAVKTRDENLRLLEKVGECIEAHRAVIADRH